jgi:hypothetical protein
VQEWLAIREKAGQELDPEIAEVMWDWVQTLDPYGVCPDIPDELNSVGREFFARAIGSDIWVQFSDLPEATAARLWQRIKAGDFRPTELEPMAMAAEFRRSGMLEPITVEQLRKLAKQRNQCFVGLFPFAVDECNELLNGRFQLVIRQTPTYPDPRRLSHQKAAN